MTCFLKGHDIVLPRVSYIGMFSYPFWLVLCFMEPQGVYVFVILPHEIGYKISHISVCKRVRVSENTSHSLTLSFQKYL